MRVFLKLFNKKGSSMLMVVIMTAVLTILGTALITATFMNSSIKYSDLRVMRSRYYSEAGIDEAYGIVASYMDDALQYATDRTDSEFDLLVLNYRNDDGTVDDTLLQAHTNEAFEDYFIEFFEDNLVAESNFGSRDYYYTNMINEIENLEGNLNEIALYSAGDSFQLSVLPTSENFLDGIENDKIIIKIESEFNYSDLAYEKLTTDIVISSPKTQYPLRILEERATLINNPIWQNAMVSSGSVIFNNKQHTNIYGDVFAKGLQERSDLADAGTDIPARSIFPQNANNVNGYGGVILGDSANIHLTYGDLTTKSYVQFVGASSELAISDRNVMCNTFHFNSGSASTVNMNNAGLYTKDDIEFNSASTYFNLNGSYYGFSVGDVAENDTHDKSSAIIVKHDVGRAGNYGELIASDEARVAGGQSVTFLVNSNDLNPTNIKKNPYYVPQQGVFIAGTAYINRESEGVVPYQTGDSIAYGRNYQIYRTVVPSEEIDVISDANNKAIIENATFVQPLSQYYLNTDLTGKMEYYEAYFDEYAGTTKGAMMYFYGSEANINFTLPSAGKLYTLGNYVSGTTASGSVESAPGSAGAVQPALDTSNAKYNFNVNTVGNWGEFYGDRTEVENSLLVKVKKIIEGLPTATYDGINDEVITPLEMYTNQGGTNELIELEGTYYKKAPITDEVVYVQFDGTPGSGREIVVCNSIKEVTYHITDTIPADYDPTISKYENDIYIEATNDFVQGVILTAGNVIIECNQPLTYTGVIMAGGDIDVIGDAGLTFNGHTDLSTQKTSDVDYVISKADYEMRKEVNEFIMRTIYNDEDYLRKALNITDSPIISVVTDETSAKLSAMAAFDDVHFISRIEIDPSTGADANKDRYADLIYFDNWRIE